MRSGHFGKELESSQGVCVCVCVWVFAHMHVQIWGLAAALSCHETLYSQSSLSLLHFIPKEVSNGICKSELLSCSQAWEHRTRQRELLLHPYMLPGDGLGVHLCSVQSPEAGKTCWGLGSSWCCSSHKNAEDTEQNLTG